ncbi:PREDICTED: superkiller viralicidic activity 2-like 2 [Acropora digitifera]|uniref:superkiller viralicidic activity 2-like 2 n=1 Tax=Acropora digitifera TaxID=70779 RepID=UPI00077A1E38|nr:PREDICTED: superkiller viralicidic activity 2-like 2 [Acropora digitifera]
MADSFGEDLFAVFEENPAPVINRKTENEKKVGDSSSATEDSEGTSKFGEKRQFKPDVIDLALDENEAKKAKFDDLDSFLETIPRVNVMSVETTEACTHEVAVPEGCEHVPLTKKPAKPAKEYPFILDPFQKESLKCLENNQSVLVSAHTSAGKTVVAEYAIAMSLQNKQRVIYTTPIKALSNQKYRELYEEFQDVGLMTGDVTINPSASALVMTTEILRNMLYRGSEVMREVAWVVFDEIHYMRDKERGVVWEETIILLPDNVHYVFLSATIPNARQFAEWIAHLHKQACHVVYTDFRPTPLQHYIYPAGGDGLFLVEDEKGEFREENFQKAMAVLREGGAESWNKRGRKGGGTKGPSSCYKIVKMIMERNFQPVIIFSFSKKECEAYALQMSKLDFNSAEEKKLVEEVFNNAIDCLSDEDKALPQVEHVLPLLVRGIGIHHSGLLPILKETIEILFSEGLIKALFATETFALGLNMPARTVVFTNARKFDGKDFRFITSGEYIQMSGRAGRRGIDDRGIIILIIDEKMGPDVGKGLLKGQPDPLNSAFHLTYNMVLNLLRVEEVNPEIMLEKSFCQFQNYASVPGMIDSMYLSLIHFFQTSVHQDNLLTYGKIGQFNDTTSLSYFSWCCCFYLQSGPVKSEPLYVIEALLNCSSKSVKSADGETPMPCGPDEKGEMQVVPILLHLVQAISAVRLYIPKDLRSPDSRQGVGKSLQEVKRRFPDGLPLLDPIEDMGIKDNGLRSVVRKTEMLEHRMFTHPLHKDSSLESLYGQYEQKAKVIAQIKLVKKELKKTKTILQLDELKCRKRVLRRLGYATAADVIELKGRVACELSSGDELLLTEMIFNGVFNELSVQQCVALLSCFVFEEKCDELPKLTEELAGPLRQMQESARRIGKVSEEAKLNINVETYVERFKPNIMDVVFAWANGASFAQICKMTDAFEGSIIRAMRRLEELLRQMCQAAKAIGNTELENKFAEGIIKIKRDIIFAASLYL